MDLGLCGDFGFMGSHYDPLPFRIVWANDSDADACRSYRHNLSSSILNAPIEEVECTPKMLYPRHDIDLVVGGFPCQDFSIAGKRRGLSSRRGRLYLHFVTAIDAIRPHVFLAENVSGLRLSGALDIILADLSALDYTVQWGLLNAADFGVPQLRRRIFIVGTDTAAAPFAFPSTTMPWINAEQAIGDLPQVKENAEIGHVWSKAKRNRGQGNKPISPDRPSPTIRAEHHGNIEFHWSNTRRLSVREVARLQSFPDSYQWPVSMSSAYRQIGNAVPPVLAWHLAKEIARCLER